MLDRVKETLIANNNRLHTTLHQFAAAGDVVAVQSLLESNEGDNNVSNSSSDTHDTTNLINSISRGKNTALHSAISHNQQGLILDCLLQCGANVHAFNTKGYNPLVLAIIHCQPGTHALQKLVDAGADWKSKYRRGKFSGLDLVDIAEQYKNQEAVEFLQQLQLKEDGKVSENEADGGTKVKRASCIGDEPLSSSHNVCPLCQCVVKFPTKMSFLQWDQEQAEKKAGMLLCMETNASKSASLISTNSNDAEKGEEKQNENQKQQQKQKKELYTSRRYLDQFLSHSNGEAYETLCQIEYHGINNKSRLRKEISESYSCLHAAQQCCIELGLGPSSLPSTGMHSEVEFQNMENVFLIDLCSGKSLTTALCSVLFPTDSEDKKSNQNNENKNNHFLAIDKLPVHQVPHFTKVNANASYLSRDIMSEAFFDELDREVRRQTYQEGRTVLLVGMHLCGNLSERAIEFFQRIELIRAMVLSPCCLPKVGMKKKKKRQKMKKIPEGHQGGEDGKDDEPVVDSNKDVKKESTGFRDNFLKRLQNGDDSYVAWVDHLRHLASVRKDEEKVGDGNIENDDGGDRRYELAVRSYRDDDIHSIKNAIISVARIQRT